MDNDNVSQGGRADKVVTDEIGSQSLLPIRSDKATDARRKNDSKSGRRISQPSDPDVLLGRGRPFQSHPGNRLMLDLVDSFRENYLNPMTRRKEKQAIVLAIFEQIRAKGGRFLVSITFS